MKEIYAVKSEDVSKTFLCYDEAVMFSKLLVNAKIKGFYSEKDAMKWLSRPIKNEGIFVVFIGKNPGIYLSVSEMKAQVTGFEGAKVGRAKTIEEAEKMFANRDKMLKEEIRQKKEKENPELKLKRKIANLKRLRLKYNGDILCFIDCEANQGKAISIGAVIYDKSKKQIVDSFYSLMRPDGFVKLDKHVEGLTKLSTQQILEAKSAKEVNNDFLSFLSMYNVSDIFSWSNNDKSFLKKSTKGFSTAFSTIKDIQPYISAITVDKYYCKNWSLENMLYIFGYDKKVEHNALSDAKDFLNVYLGWINNKIFEERLNEIILKRRDK